MIPTRQILCGLFAILTFPCLLTAQQEVGVSQADGQILSEIGQHNDSMTNLEYLSDVIGPRLTGSAQQNMASEWAEREFRRYNLTNVHQEKWTIAHSWTRGTAEARVIAPISRRLAIVSAGWSPGYANGEVQGSVVYVSAQSASELDRYKAKLTGAIVILEEPHPVTPPYEVGHPSSQFQLQAPYAEPGTDVSPARAFYQTRTNFLRGSGSSCHPEGFRESV